MMMITLRSVYLMVAVLHVLAFSTILCKINVEREKRSDDDEDLIPDDEFIYRNSIFFDNIPVWIAYSDPILNQILYEELHPNLTISKTVINDVVNHWKSGKFEKLSKRQRRSVEESADIVLNNVENLGIETLPKSSMTNVSKKSVKKRELDGMSYDPSILLIMYDNNPKLFGKQIDNSHYYDMILYAIAFWNAVGLRLSMVEDFYIEPKITGIVIAGDPEGVPYLANCVEWSSGRLKVPVAFASMMEYWRLKDRTNSSFPDVIYDMVVTMTNHESTNADTVKSSGQKLCNEPDGRNITGLLVLHDYSFENTQWAAEEISKMRESCIRDSPKSKKFPIPLILPKDVISEQEECVLHGYDPPYICKEMTSCESVRCTYNSIWYTCRGGKSFSTPDGTECEEDKMCVNGKCVRFITNVPTS